MVGNDLAEAVRTRDAIRECAQRHNGEPTKPHRPRGGG